MNPLRPTCSFCGYARPMVSRVPCPNCGSTAPIRQIRMELEELRPGFLKWSWLAIDQGKRLLLSVLVRENPTIDLSGASKKAMTYRAKGR